MNEHADTVPEGSRLVVWSPWQPKLIVNRGRYIVVGDYELMMMMIKQWRADGMSREDVIELMFYDSKPIRPPKPKPRPPEAKSRFYSKW